MTCLNAPTTRCTAFSRAECRHRACDRQRERTARAAARACLDRRQLATAVLLSAAVSRPAQAGGEGGRCTLDLAVDGQKQGSITIELLDGTSTGCRRFSDLCKGVQGVGYRRSKIDALFPGKYIASPGVAALSYGEGESPIAGGDATAPLVRELEASPLRHDAAGLVSLEVNPMVDILENKKLVAEKGKLVEIIERSGVIPNGTGFAITTGPAPELDGKYLIVGRVVEGLALADEISKLPVVKDNSNSPFFKAGKAIGDKRAVVAEMGFNRPFNKVTVAASRLQ